MDIYLKLDEKEFVVMNLKSTNNYRDIVLNDTPLIDVRAPIEYEKGTFRNSVNLPILTNDERHVIGICYKEKGNEEATKLGYKIVSGKVKEDRLQAWVEFIDNNPEAIIYCFRGGSRSTIAQNWIVKEGNRNIEKLEDGYKGFRNYLINALLPENINSEPVIISGYTGSGKTILLNELNNSVDLEGIANHRGSAFGHNITPQPTQINFENNLAYDIIKHKANNYKYLILEDEGKNIGRSYVPMELYKFIAKGKIIMLEVSLEERISNILKDYVIDAQSKYLKLNNDEEIALNLWYSDIESSINKVKHKLGGDRCKIALEALNSAYANQKNTGNYDEHSQWISLLLQNYYDPMYNHSINKGNREVIFKGTKDSVKEFINSIENKNR